MIIEAAARDDVDLNLVSVDSTVARAHHHAAGMVVDPDLLEDLEKALAEEMGLRQRDKKAPQSRNLRVRRRPNGHGAARYADAARSG